MLIGHPLADLPARTWKGPATCSGAAVRAASTADRSSSRRGRVNAVREHTPQPGQRTDEELESSLDPLRPRSRLPGPGAILRRCSISGTMRPPWLAPRRTRSSAVRSIVGSRAEATRLTVSGQDGYPIDHRADDILASVVDELMRESVAHPVRSTPFEFVFT